MNVIHPRQTEPVIIAQSSPSNPPQTNSNIPFVWIAGTIAATLILVFVISQGKQLSEGLRALFKSESPLQTIPSQEFAIDIEVNNVRTQDYLRANLEATIYVYIADNTQDKQKAEKFLVINEDISADDVEKSVKKRAESAIRGSASQEKTLDDIHKNREKIGQKAKDIMGDCLKHLGLTVRDIAIGEIEESPYYEENNYFDAQALASRTKTIQEAILTARKNKLDTEEKILEHELNSEKFFHTKKLEVGKEIKIQEFKIELEVEREEVEHQKESLENLATLEKVEKSKIEHELKLELHRNEKEKELQKEIEITELKTRKEIETEELNLKKEIESLKTQTEIEIQLEKLLQDTKFINTHKEFQKLQANVRKEIEIEEIVAMISILEQEQIRLKTETERAKAEETLTTTIEEAQSERQKLKAKIAAESVEHEVKRIEGLAKAERQRYDASIPANDADRTAQLIRELTPTLMENLPQLAEMLKALAPQPGILGESNIYTFPNGNGEDINKLMVSTSGILLLKSLLDGKLGHLLGQSLRSLKNDNGNLLSKDERDDDS